MKERLFKFSEDNKIIDHSEQLEEEYGFSQSWQNKARMVSSGSTLPFHKVGKFIKYDRQEIDQWIENHKVR